MKFRRSFYKNPLNTKEKTERLTLKERIASLKNIPSFLKLVWQASPSITIANLVLRIAKSILPVVNLYIWKLIIDNLVHVKNGLNENPSHSNLWKLIVLAFGIALISDAITKIIAFLDTLLGTLLSNYTSVKIMSHAATLDLEQFEDSTFLNQLELAREQTVGRTLLLEQILKQIQDLITICFLSVGVILFNPLLIGILLIAVLPAIIGEYYFNGKNYFLIRKQTEGRRKLEYIRYVGASYETAKEIKIFDLSNFLINRFQNLSHQFYIDNKRLGIKRTVWGIGLSLFGYIGYFTTLVLIIQSVFNGTSSIGDLSFLVGSFQQMRTVLGGLMERFNSIFQGAIYLRDFFGFFEITPSIKDPLNSRSFPKPIQHGFTFEDVSFRYNNSQDWAIRHLSFTIYAGEKLALVGENGAGKTTVVKLLTRLYSPTEGRILLDGYDLREYNLTELRTQVGIIFQDFIRYQMTTSENIAVGNIKEKDNNELIQNSAKKSFAHIIIEKFPNKYNQMLGKQFKDGIELSGGQWQKIALARAYMGNSQLLILDEPTAALDAKAEYEVFQHFSDLTQDKSAVLISHRFSTVRMANRILVLEKGQLLEIGSHVELLKKGGRYAELFKLQAMGYQ